MENHCLVCGQEHYSSKYGHYCTKECRDSELGILGKTCICEECGREFKSFEIKHCCDICLEAKKLKLNQKLDLKSSLSEFEYSIFEENLKRILHATNEGDSINRTHAIHKLSETLQKSKLSDYIDVCQESPDKSILWLNNIVNKLNDKEIIKELEKIISKTSTTSTHKMLLKQ